MNIVNPFIVYIDLNLHKEDEVRAQLNAFFVNEFNGECIAFKNLFIVSIPQFPDHAFISPYYRQNEQSHIVTIQYNSLVMCTQYLINQKVKFNSGFVFSPN